MHRHIKWNFKEIAFWISVHTLNIICQQCVSDWVKMKSSNFIAICVARPERLATVTGVWVLCQWLLSVVCTCGVSQCCTSDCLVWCVHMGCLSNVRVIAWCGVCKWGLWVFDEWMLGVVCTCGVSQCCTSDCFLWCVHMGCLSVVRVIACCGVYMWGLWVFYEWLLGVVCTFGASECWASDCLL